MPQDDYDQILSELRQLTGSFGQYRVEQADRLARLEERLASAILKLEHWEKLDARIEALEREKHEADGKRKVVSAISAALGGLLGGVIGFLAKALF